MSYRRPSTAPRAGALQRSGTSGLRIRRARALLRWPEGARMTPPLYGIWRDKVGDEVKVEGGNHRVAVADAVGVKRIPAYVRQTDLADFRRLVPGAVPIQDVV